MVFDSDVRAAFLVTLVFFVFLFSMKYIFLSKKQHLSSFRFVSYFSNDMTMISIFPYNLV